MTPPIYAIVDANNFFVSCERAFDPSIWFRPVAVLSNNDGCVISRSQEVRALDIKMGTPAFMMRHLRKRHGIVLRSSNFELYGNMSARFMQALKLLCPAVESYSVDEAFVDLTGIPNVMAFAWKARKQVMQSVHIPSSWGISTTKTLAKVANKFAKKYPEMRGVFDMTNPNDIDAALGMLKVKHIWGIGRRQEVKIEKLGIITARQLRDMDNDDIYRHFNSVVMMRLVMELRGIPCKDMVEEVQTRKNVTVSRTFADQIGDIERIRRAVAAHINRCGEKLRKQQLAANYLGVYLRTDPHRQDLKQRAVSQEKRLILPTNNLLALQATAQNLLTELFEDGIVYRKVGVYAGHLVPVSALQTGLFAARNTVEDDELMSRMDSLNRKYGRGTIRTALEGYDRSWRSIRNLRSPCYTTDIKQVPIVKI